MCLLPVSPPQIPAETARVARAAFPKGHPYLAVRDAFGPLFADLQFASLYGGCGTPALSPGQLALVTLLQFAEGLSDQQAADAVRSRLDWKYLLGLELTDPGFEASVLSEFRSRLLAGSQETLLFDTLLAHCRTHGLLRARGTQRTDSTHVLARIRSLSRLELAGETLRVALDTLATAAPDWLRTLDPAQLTAWADRYGRPVTAWRLPRGEAPRREYAQQIAADGGHLLAQLAAPGTPAAVADLPAVVTLRTVWAQQYMEDPAATGGWRWRTAEELPGAGTQVTSPHDPEARFARKRQTEWEGYKVHVTETCEADQPLLITDVQTTAAGRPDQEALAAIQGQLQAREVLPAQQLVDTGYLEAASLVRSQEEYGVELVGPARADTAWQARAQTGYAAADFTVQWEAQVAVCPAGKQSVKWREAQDHGHPVIEIRFAAEDCQACPAREQCSRAREAGRRLTVRPQAEQAALQEARARQKTPEFAAEYAARSGVEGALSQGVRRSGLRRCRYVGEAKARLQHLLIGAGLNLVRVGEWLRGTPRAQTRVLPFARFVAALGT